MSDTLALGLDEMTATERALVAEHRRRQEVIEAAKRLGKPSKQRAFYERFTYVVVEYQDVRVGDLYANNGTVTKVEVGPVDGDGWSALEEGKVRIHCGGDFSTTAKPTNCMVVGRLT